MYRIIIHLLLPILMLSGCMVVAPDSDVVEDVVEKRGKIIVGKTTRNEVEELLGEPFIRNDHLRVEVYRVSEDTVFYYLLTPLPVPVGANDATAYSLVVYDENFIISDIDWGVFQSSDSVNDDGADDHERQTARLQAGDFVFESFEVKFVYPQTEILFGRESDTRKSLFSNQPRDTCILYYAPGKYEYKVLSDDAVLASYRTAFLAHNRPVDNHGWYLGFMVFVIQPGEHTFSIATRSLDITPGRFNKEFTCNPGDKLYAYPSIEVYRSPDKNWRPLRYRGDIVISKSIPEVFNGRRLILYDGEKWIGPY